jgi:hypothetical protein
MEKTVAEIRAAGGKADVISADLHDASGAREVARRAIELGNDHVDILIPTEFDPPIPIP